MREEESSEDDFQVCGEFGKHAGDKLQSSEEGSVRRA
jgi:hypothetical protein